MLNNSLLCFLLDLMTIDQILQKSGAKLKENLYS